MVKRKKSVAVAMSGGVDSSVAAAILVNQGFNVTAVTMAFNFLDGQSVKNARRVADSLGISHRVVDLTWDLENKVINNFTDGYLSGKTPNPCVRCNQYVKFGALLRHSLAWGCDFLATGHYARKIKSRADFLLRKGQDKNKDQSYFLYRLNQRQLSHLLFPLGNLTKQEVIKIARRLRLPVAQQKESQEICFLPGADYRGFLKKRVTADIKSGPVVDKAGNVLGRHQGIPFYTIGQREGLNIALGRRAYVVGINPAKNQIVLGDLGDAYGREFTVVQSSFILRLLKKKVVYKVKIRYNHQEAEAMILRCGRTLRVRFRQPQFAITPGQSAVFYHGDIVMGGGIIR
ncbi:MAG: tRNA 2-thiouridine(34) synthase MnmA [Candidatus Omnitrophota bacterium]|jgi:tRNA-specific 2-thiouridylase